MTKSNWIKRSESPYQANEVCFLGEAYSPHRHDTYTFAVTYFGVQSFNYRRELRHSLPGQVVVLHPDELHDGQAGTEAGFRYRSISIQPQVFRSILPVSPLPHLDGGVSTDSKLTEAVHTLCRELDAPLEDMEREEALLCLVRRMASLTGETEKGNSKPDYAAARLARSFIEDNLSKVLSIEDVAAAADKNRWELSRTFKAAYGTSPSRYITQRRLSAAMRLLIEGTPLSEAAVACGFYDQSHFTRHFKNVFGITPSRWLALLL